MANAIKDQELPTFMFDNTLQPVSVQQYTLMRGVTDFTQLAQFDLYETGYSFLVLLKIPIFLDVMRNNSDGYKQLIDNYEHIIEYDFRGAQGIEAMTSETNSLTNGISDLNIITKVTEQAGSSFTMQYFERSGSVITKTHEAFLRGIKDPRTQIKRYNGILQKSFNPTEKSAKHEENLTNFMQDKGYQYEIFHFLLIITDNTGLNLEKAYILASCQPSQANTEIYNVQKGEYNFSELSLQFNGYPISGRIVNAKAKEFLAWINKYTCFDEMDYAYSILNDSQFSDPEKHAMTPSKILTNKDGVQDKAEAISASYEINDDVVGNRNDNV